MVDRPRTSVLLLQLLLLVSAGTAAPVAVKITPPDFAGIGAVLTDPAKELVSKKQLDAFIGGPLGTLEAQASRLLSQSLSKPRIFRGMADAVTLPVLALGRAPWPGSRVSLALVSGAGVQSDSFDPAVLGTRLKTLSPDQDYDLGASAQPLGLTASVTLVPGEWSWSAGAFGSWARLAYPPVSLVTWSAGALVSVRWVPPVRTPGVWDWEGLALTLGGGWAQNRYETTLTVALPTQVVAMDLTYVKDTVTIAARPTVRIDFDTRGLFVPLQLSTEVSLFRTLHCGLFGGAVWARGWSSVGLHGTNPVSVTGLLVSQFIGTTASVSVDGEVGGEAGPWVQAFAGAVPSWSVGSFRFGVPLTWRFPGGLGASVSWGLAL